MEEYKIEAVKEEYSQRVWEIRNHSSVRKNSGNSEIISFENHQRWFHKKYFEKENNFCYVLKDKKNIAGYCRFDYDKGEEAYVISIAIDPENQSKGLGSRLLSQSLKKMKNKKKIPLLAEIKKENSASIKLFEKNGFEKYKENKGGFYYRKV
jgi:ribosomal protein S18 acetylase RimI-like enzyme